MKKLQYTAFVLCIAGASFLAGHLLRGYLNKPIPQPSTKYGSIVRLTRDGRTFCSGTVISNNLIVTAAHCVLEQTPFGYMMTQSEINIRPRDNTDLNVDATVVYATPQMDQAMITGDFTDFESRDIITDPKALEKLGTTKKRFVSCGYPLNGDLYCNDMDFSERRDFFWATNGILIPGMSGGPAMTVSGVVVGVNVAVEKDKSIISPIYNILSNLPKGKDK